MRCTKTPFIKTSDHLYIATLICLFFIIGPPNMFIPKVLSS